MIGGVEAKHLWTPPGEPWNLVENGSLETSITGWQNLGNYVVTGSTLTRDTSIFKRGAASLKMVGGAVQYHGMRYAFPAARIFKAGVPVTVEFWARVSTGTANMDIGLGQELTPFDTATGSVALTTTFQRFTLTWTPAADRTTCAFWMRQPTTTARTVYLDEVLLPNPYTFTLNDRSTFPRAKVRAVTLAGLGDPEDNFDPRVGAGGEIPRTSFRRGKPITYEGVIEALASTGVHPLTSFRTYEAAMREAFRDELASGRMDVKWANGLGATPADAYGDFAGEAPKFYDARALGLDIGDPVEAASMYRATFVLALRNHDGRYYERPETSAGVALTNSNTEYSFA